MNALPFSHPQHKTCLYAGRFQPFHLGHYKTFLELCKTCLGNCYIVTSNKEETGISVILFKAVHLTSSPLLGMKELNKLIEETKLNKDDYLKFQIYSPQEYLLRL